MKQVVTGIFLADGFEEVEAVTPIDFLRRAGINLIIAGVGRMTVTGAHGLKVCADVDAADLPANVDAVILPGGMPGASHLASSETVVGIIRKKLENDFLVAAICASPALVLGKNGLLDTYEYTCYPGFEEQSFGGKFRPDRVVRDRNLITSRGPGTSADFAIEIIRYFMGEKSADTIARETLQHI